MNVPARIAETFRDAPYATRIAFHRSRDLAVKREVELSIPETPRKNVPVPPPTDEFLRKVFFPLPGHWFGTLQFTWTPDAGWEVSTRVHDEFVTQLGKAF